MTVYPFSIDDDSTILRIDNNLTEIGGEVSNQLRDAVFAIQLELGITPSGSASSVAARLNQSLNQDGSIKSSAIASVGLVTLPISDSQVGTNAGIKEFKLALDYSTSDLNTLIAANTALLNALTTFTSITNSNLNTHIAGGSLLADNSPARHVASHIDLNDTPFDIRDTLFTWSGLFDKDGVARSATTVAEALDQINTDFINHQNEVLGAHVATAVSVDTDNFQEIPQTIDTVQKLADHIDDFEVITIADHRATQHANCVPKIGRVSACSLPDGYGQNVVVNTPINTFLVRSPNITPVDSISNGDDIVTFKPADNSDFSFDAQFSQVRIGDIIRINYGSGFEASFYVESIRFTPDFEWIVRINGVNLVDSSDGYASARIDRPLFDRNTSGILAVAAANATPTGSFDTILQSVIVGHPSGAVAIGNGFDPGQFDADHYNLWLELYPTGSPSDRVISLPAIDVTGNSGTTPGKYTLDSIVHETNKKFREIGYNYRFIAFADHSDFAIMLADAINCASFAIISGSISSGSFATGTFSENVIGDATAPPTKFDAFGFGNTHADVASPNFGSTFIDKNIAQLPTKVIVPFKSRDYIVDGQRKEGFAATWLATLDTNGNGYWDGYISDRVVAGASIETTYTIFLDLKAAELKPGKTIVIQPVVEFSDTNYFDVDYGRFIIKSIIFPTTCPGDLDQTQITVISGIHAAGSGVASSSGPDLAVKLYFSEDSVSFNSDNVIDSAPSGVDYHRLHEVFIDKNGKTFGHERGRMPIQSEGTSPPLLSTTTWHIEGISPKLRGYRDDSITFNKYIRLKIISYDSVSGEYTGYIGKRDPWTSATSDDGPLTTGRKGVPTRFYDETNVDYIDLIFVEDSASAAGIPILSSSWRYVDIELFNSLQLNDDLMLLATVEVNWDPKTSQEIIQRVINKREFGSIGEEDFTESAIDFITSGDRHLHENGILRGFDFYSVSSTDNRQIFYKGGVALVNGKVLTTNAISVTIPSITEDPIATGTLNWAICVNEDGFLEPILITLAKDQFWALENTSSSTYHIPSVTFAELVDTRKDLVPIDVVTVTIASFTVDNNADVRRFIDDGKDRGLVYSSSDVAGTFHTAEALVNWTNNYASSNSLVAKVRGEFDISTSIDFTGLTNGLILEGDGAVFNITADKGLLINSNLTLRNIIFNYNPDTSAISFSSINDKINSTNGCIYSTGSVSDVIIERCVFNSEVTVGGGTTGQRPSFISFEINKEDVVQNTKIVENTFNDTGGTVAGVQAAFAIVSLNDSGDTDPAIVYNVRIKDNNCKQRQGIYILQEAIDQVSFVNSIDGPGIRTYNVIVSGNNCGVIGYLTSAFAVTANNDRVGGLIIRDNVCHIIGQMVNYAYNLAVSPGTKVPSLTSFKSPYSVGGVDICNNKCNMIIIISTDYDLTTTPTAFELSRQSIEHNTVVATDPAILNDWGSLGGTNQYFGIFVGEGSDDIGEVIIANNVLTSGLVSGTEYYFNTSIRVGTSVNIIGNIIRGIEISGFGIQVSATSVSRFRQSIISGNQIFREGRSIAIYISLEADSALGGGLCVDNYLDDYVVSGTNNEVISGSGTSPSGTRANTWIVERNKNQTEVMHIIRGGGTVAINDLIIGSASSTVQNKDAPDAYFFSYSPSGSTFFNWRVYLPGILPNGVELIDAALGVRTSNASASVKTAEFSIMSVTHSAGETIGPINLTATNQSLALSAIPLGNSYFNFPAEALQLFVKISVQDVGSFTVTAAPILITFRW